jgi:hypothetical protein
MSPNVVAENCGALFDRVEPVSQPPNRFCDSLVVEVRTVEESDGNDEEYVGRSCGDWTHQETKKAHRNH